MAQLIEYLPLLARGAVITIALALIALAVATLLGGLGAAGKLGVDDFAFQDPEQELALGWKSLAIELKEANVPLGGGAEPVRVALGKIALDAPEARYNLAICRYRMGKLEKNAAKQKELIEGAERDIKNVAVVDREYGGENWKPKFDTLAREIQRDLKKKQEGVKAFEIEIKPVANSSK